MLNLILLLAGTVLAFWVSAICGGGASLILIPILNLILPASVVPFSLTVGTFSSSASRIAVFRKHISWKIFLWFVPFSIPSVLAGAWLIKYINPNYLQLIVSVFLIINLPEFFKSKKSEEISEKRYPNILLAIIGICAGFVSGITGAIGLLFNRFYLKFGLTKEEIVATRAANEIFLHVIKIIIYISLGLFSQKALWIGLAIALGAIISSFTVKYILPYLSEFIFKKIGYGAMVISGIFLFAGTGEKIIQEDHISLSTHQKESVLSWKNRDFIIEFTYDDGFEVERPINHTELPSPLKEHYHEILSDYDKIHLEKVFRFAKNPSYEFYCYKEGKLTKFEL